MINYKKCEEAGSIAFGGKTLKIYTTNEDIFKKQTGNREVRPSHVKKLIKSFGKVSLFTLILVNEKGEVLDGQHRLQAMVDVGIPITFIVIPKYGLEETKVLNDFDLNWSTDAQMDSYVELGYDAYVTYKDFKDQYKFKHSVSQQLLVDKFADGGITSDDFKYGKFKIKDLNKSKRYASMLHDFSGSYKKFGVRSFVVAMVDFFNHPEYNHQRMVYAMESHSVKLNGNVKSVSEYKISLNQYYNHGLSKKKRLFIMSPEEILKG